MVEFALVLPILLMVTYGLLETGRLLFIFGSTVTAARQAARYGSAIGTNASNVPYYRDCDGIDAEVNRLGFIHTYNDINVTYDRGVDGSGNAIAISGIDPAPSADTCTSMNDTTLINGDRIKVQVTTQWQPIIAVVPSWQGFAITSSAERTILVGVDISVTPSGGTWGGPGGTLSLVTTSPTTFFDGLDDVISYTYTITNTSALTLLGPFTVSDSRATTDCSSAPGSLASGASTTCTGTAIPTQNDLDAGFLTNSATASGGNSTSNASGVTVPAVQYDTVELLDISPSPDVATVPGVLINYTYRFRNSGNVTLTSPYTISDDKVAPGDINCSGAASTLAPGDITECQGAYVITAGDIVNGVATNTAAVKAQFEGVDTPYSNYLSADVYTSPIVLTIIPPLEITGAGTVTYKYNLKNVSTVTYHAAYNVQDNRVTGITCPSNSIDPGDTIQCTGDYTITQTMMDAGGDIANQASATANSGTISSNTANATTTITQTPAVALSVTPSTLIVTNPLPTSVGYIYTIENMGNVTLTAPFEVTTTGLFNNPTCIIASGTLAPQTTTDCTLTYPLQQEDMDAGSIISAATVEVTHNSNQYYAQAPSTVITHNAPRLTLLLTSNPTSFSAAGQSLTFTFKLRNTGNTPLSGPFSVALTAPSGISVTCGSLPDPLPLGQFINCSANSNYNTAGADITNGSVSVQGTGYAGALSSALNESIPYIFTCDLTNNAITFGSDFMQLTISSDINNSGTISISQIEIYNYNFSTHIQQRISSLQFASSTIWSGSSARANYVPFSSFVGDYTLPIGQGKILRVNFNRDYTPKSAAPKERIVVTFNNAACPVIDVSVP